MNNKNGAGEAKPSAETILTHLGREPAEQFGFVNTPVYRGSTVVFETLAEHDDPSQPYLYGRAGNPTTTAVERLVTELEGAFATSLLPSGLAAITVAILSAIQAGDEVLVTDSAYGPVRAFCDQFLTRMGASVRYYDPRIGAGIADLLTERTKAIWVESPGSLTFEIQDLPAIVAVAKPRGIKVMVDNSWATPLYHHPLALGADVVVHAGTKMFVGHSDVLVGTVSATEAAWPEVLATRRLLGFNTSGDDAFLTARGLRTLAIRMKEHAARSIELAQWLEGQDGVEQVIHPALSSHPDHALFKRDFNGAGSLFAIRLTPGPRKALAAMMDNFRLFAMGYSWGGYESLCLPINPAKIRTAVPWTAPGHMLRIHVGLEGLDDLKADLAAGLERYLSALPR
ncbi:MAG TPA: cystathionine beta-lyase [Devosiaceae bacterium]|nr:cystathionine beta-lyase [Devosiaceae bacterium]